jgi:hypothetical protein
MRQQSDTTPPIRDASRLGLGFAAHGAAQTQGLFYALSLNREIAGPAAPTAPTEGIDMTPVIIVSACFLVGAFSGTFAFALLAKEPRFPKGTTSCSATIGRSRTIPVTSAASLFFRRSSARWFTHPFELTAATPLPHGSD